MVKEATPDASAKPDKMHVLRITRRDGTVHDILYDAADAELIESRTWHVTAVPAVPGRFYAQSSFRKPGGKVGTVQMHILLMGRPGVDHIDANGLNNRRANLRFATPAQNAANQLPSKGGTSRYKGVAWISRRRQWVAQIKVDGRQTHIGYFTDEKAAAEAYDSAALAAFGEFARPNFPARPQLTTGCICRDRPDWFPGQPDNPRCLVHGHHLSPLPPVPSCSCRYALAKVAGAPGPWEEIRFPGIRRGVLVTRCFLIDPGCEHHGDLRRVEYSDATYMDVLDEAERRGH